MLSRQGSTNLEISSREVEEDQDAGNCRVVVPVLANGVALGNEVEQHRHEVTDAGVEAEKVEHFPEMLGDDDGEDEHEETDEGEGEADVPRDRQPVVLKVADRLLYLLG